MLLSDCSIFYMDLQNCSCEQYLMLTYILVGSMYKQNLPNPSNFVVVGLSFSQIQVIAAK